MNKVKLVDRYVGRAALMGMLSVWFAMTVLFILLSLLGELRLTQGDYGTGDVFWFIALTTPSMAYQIFPISALEKFGTACWRSPSPIRRQGKAGVAG